MDELMHHGILGMKWGVRRTPEQLGHKKKNNEKKYSPVIKKASNMSDDELRKTISRLQLEKQYKDLTRSQISFGEKWVRSVLNDSLKQLATKQIVKLGENIINSYSKKRN